MIGISLTFQRQLWPEKKPIFRSEFERKKSGNENGSKWRFITSNKNINKWGSEKRKFLKSDQPFLSNRIRDNLVYILLWVLQGRLILTLSFIKKFSAQVAWSRVYFSFDRKVLRLKYVGIKVNPWEYSQPVLATMLLPQHVIRIGRNIQ